MHCMLKRITDALMRRWAAIVAAEALHQAWNLEIDASSRRVATANDLLQGSHRTGRQTMRLRKGENGVEVRRRPGPYD